MRSCVLLCVLGLFGLHSSVLRQEAVGVQTGVLIFCDDPSVEKAVHSALNAFNKDVVTGYKLALYRIRSATKAENGSDSVYSLQFSSRRSDCPAGSMKDWKDCDYLPSRQRKPISCNATVLMMETDAETKQVDCLIEDHAVAERASCMGCPEQIDENSDDLRVPVTAAITKFNSISNHSHLFSLHEVGDATRQVVAGFRYKMKFDMKKTTCTKEANKELHEQCVHDEENLEFVNCNSTVDTAPWRLESPAVHIHCESGPMFMPFQRRRPPGFSPLRNRLYDRPSSSASAPTSPPPQASTTQSTVKEESSEEELPTTNPNPEAVNDNPFHCPSKPWKPFRPLRPGATGATKAPQEPATPELPAEGTFSDSDLLS